jgi:hypothetical protein
MRISLRAGRLSRQKNHAEVSESAHVVGWLR